MTTIDPARDPIEAIRNRLIAYGVGSIPYWLSRKDVVTLLQAVDKLRAEAK